MGRNSLNPRYHFFWQPDHPEQQHAWRKQTPFIVICANDESTAACAGNALTAQQKPRSAAGLPC
jgi:hypothetical protein